MARKVFYEVVGRIVVDDKFRDLLFSEPEKALARYDLTPGERKKILALEAKSVKASAARLGQRITPKKFEI